MIVYKRSNHGEIKLMGFKRDLIKRIADIQILKTRKIKRKSPNFHIIDSTLEGHFGVLIPTPEIPHFKRQSKSFGLTYSKANCKTVGSFNSWTLLNVHVVEPKDFTTPTLFLEVKQ